jgi:hypothetical protein
MTSMKRSDCLYGAMIGVAVAAMIATTGLATEPLVESSAPSDGISGEMPPTALPEPELAPLSLDLRVAGTALKPRGSDVEHTPSGGGGCFYVSGGNDYRIFNVPLVLPQGAVVNVVRMYYDDTSASDSIGWFTVYDLYGDIVDEFSVTSSGSSGNGYNNTGTIDHQVDYGSHSYVLNWRSAVTGSAMQLCGFRVFYDMP